MKVLLDENLDHALRKLLGQHEVVTVTFMGWAGLKNGELLRAAEESGIDVLVTGDQTLNYEQNLRDGDWRLWRFQPFNCPSSKTIYPESWTLSTKRPAALYRRSNAELSGIKNRTKIKTPLLSEIGTARKELARYSFKQLIQGIARF